MRPVGVLKMQDEAGGDEKIIAVPVPRLTRRYEKVHNYTDLPEITCKQVQHFFEHYKDLEPTKWVKVTGWARRGSPQLYSARHRARQAGQSRSDRNMNRPDNSYSCNHTALKTTHNCNIGPSGSRFNTPK